MTVRLAIIIALAALAPFSASAHGGVAKNAEGGVTVHLSQSPLSPLVGETVEMTFSFRDAANAPIAGLPVALALIDTFHGDASKDVAVRSESLTTDVNGGLYFSHVFDKENHFDVELKFANPATGEEEVTGFLVQPRAVPTPANTPRPSALAAVIAALAGGLIGWSAGRKRRPPAGGFSLVELLVSIAIIAVLATIVVAALGPARRDGRDKARIAAISSLGRFLLAGNCYVPQDGAGDYDFEALYQEIAAANPAVRQFLSAAPKDPSLGTDAQSGYRYVYAADGHCAIYANLENAGAPLTNETVAAPSPGASGTFRGAIGPNGTDRWYQLGK